MPERSVILPSTYSCVAISLSTSFGVPVNTGLLIGAFNKILS